MTYNVFGGMINLTLSLSLPGPVRLLLNNSEADVMLSALYNNISSRHKT